MLRRGVGDGAWSAGNILGSTSPRAGAKRTSLALESCAHAAISLIVPKLLAGRRQLPKARAPAHSSTKPKKFANVSK